MLKNKYFFFSFCLYSCFSLWIIFSSVSSYTLHDNPRLFYKDPNSKERLVAAIASDHDMVLLTRLFHNKILVSWQVFSDSIYRSVDVPFLFPLTERTALYDNPGRMQMLPFYELPFFFIGFCYFIKRWDKMKKIGISIFCLFLFSLLISGLVWPFIFPVKLIVLMISVQFVVFFGCFGFIEDVLWRKK